MSSLRTPYSANLERLTKMSKWYRRVLFTTKHMQLVIMSLPPLEDIPEEIHKSTTQFIRVEEGDGLAVVDGKRYKLTDGICIVIPAKAKHHILNTSEYKTLKLYTIYSPPHHPRNTKQKTRPA